MIFLSTLLSLRTLEDSYIITVILLTHLMLLNLCVKNNASWVIIVQNIEYEVQSVA